MAWSRRSVLKGVGGAAAGGMLGHRQLTSHGQEAPAEGRISITLWGNKQDVDSQRAAVAKYQELFPQVEIEVTEGGCGVAYADCKTLIAGGTMPDVFPPGIWNYNAMVNDDVVEDLEPYIQRDRLNLGDFNPKITEGLRALRDGKVYGLPMGFNMQSLFFNQDMFDAAGLTYPPADGNYTWQDLQGWAKKLTLDEDGNNAESAEFDPDRIAQWGFATLAVLPIAAAFDPVLLAFGGSTMSLPDRQSCNLEHPDSIRAWQFIQDLMWVDHSTVKPDANQEQAGYLRWVNGTVAMQQGSHEQVGLVREQNPSMRSTWPRCPRRRPGMRPRSSSTSGASTVARRTRTRPGTSSGGSRPMARSRGARAATRR